MRHDLQSKLMNAMNESATQKHIKAMEGAEFVPQGSTLSDIINEGISFLAEEANTAVLNGIGTQSFLVESAIEAGLSGMDADLDNYSFLTENVFKSAVDTAKRWYAKAASFFKAVVQKIKDNIQLMTANKSKWRSIISARLDKKTTADQKDFTYTGIKWKKPNISGTVKTYDESKINAELAKPIALATAGKNIMNQNTITGSAISGFLTMNGSKEDGKAKEAKVLKAIFGYADKANMKTDLTKELKGTGAKVEIKGFSLIGPKEMYNVIDKESDFASDQADALTKIQEHLEKGVTEMQEVHTFFSEDLDLDKIYDKLEGKEKSDKVTKLNEFKKEFAAKISEGIKLNQAISAMCATTNDCYLSLAKEQSKEYMTVLTKYVKTKSTGK